MFLARMNLVGFHEAGKTSLAKRLMRKDFDAGEKSTEGIALHYIQSKFNRAKLVGKHWREANITTNDLYEEFIEEIKLSVNDGIRRREKQDEDGCRDHKMIPEENQPVEKRKAKEESTSREKFKTDETPSSSKHKEVVGISMSVPMKEKLALADMTKTIRENIR